MIEDPLNWIIDNKEWVFSGIGIFALSAIVGLITWISGRRKVASQKKQNQQLTSDQTVQKAPGLARSSLHRANIEDVKKFDPKTRSLLRVIEDKDGHTLDEWDYRRRERRSWHSNLPYGLIGFILFLRTRLSHILFFFLSATLLLLYYFW